MIEQLIKSGETMTNIATKLNECTEKLVKAELKIDLTKSQLAMSNGIAGLGNQALRDARMTEILQTDPEYEPNYREFMELKTLNKVLYTQWILVQELNKNIRAMLMNGGDNR